MKNFLKFAALGVMLASTAIAYAGPLDGGLNISTVHGGIVGGNVTFDPTTTSVSFSIDPANTSYYGTGSFTGSTAANYMSTFTFTLGAPATAGSALFSFTDGGTVTFYATTVNLYGPGNASLYFLGYLSGGMFSSTAASYTITPLYSTQTGPTTTFVSDLEVPPVSGTPEPSSLVLLGTGLVSAAGMMMRKRRVVA